MRSFSNDRVNISLLSFQSPRDTAARVGNYSDFPTRVKLSHHTPVALIALLVEEMGLEPTTLGLQSRCSTS
jgi:hypothetical protein